MKNEFLLRLSLLKGVGTFGKQRIYQFAKKHQRWQFDSFEIRLLAQTTKPNDWNEWTADRLYEIKKNHRYLTIEDKEYPESLRHVPTPPLVLFYKGDLTLLNQEHLAIVGAREATDYGYHVIQKLMPELVKRGFVIVSGLAKGIDSFAHQFAISNQGKTIGVVGTGLDICYPKASGNLQIEMSRQHLVLSEYPNGTSPAKFHFPMRNRIIAGLSSGVLVIEAKKRSGSLITAQQALDYGKDVFAVPGSILNERSSGCHQLIQDGAICVEKPQDILDSYDLWNKIH
ncbi:DNA-processing protein DprA [Enterococcus xiangfangensis]|uniref:DNA-processing protein DprA n=1 Tax=Enterococcus xiangfangensis TaxID=1296537 RepID=A0ABU3F9P6_9ENTE|nr:DNA-processing protein DprA [Enterococcus xiangfangensis]MBM7711418.1 DNA processing protein [Enterococcus xiangfangensis]MDT2759386.1 DNA-processing protein DprA [Enterococcus xiangfangensis]NBK09305.1 DNA-protecting protein DprA [Enterococcus asini]